MEVANYLLHEGGGITGRKSSSPTDDQDRENPSRHNSFDAALEDADMPVEIPSNLLDPRLTHATRPISMAISSRTVARRYSDSPAYLEGSTAHMYATISSKVLHGEDIGDTDMSYRTVFTNVQTDEPDDEDSRKPAKTLENKASDVSKGPNKVG